MTERYHERSCAYCNMAFKEGTDTILCSNCETYHHKECWAAHAGKCSTLRCDGKGILIDNLPGVLSETG